MSSSSQSSHPNGPFGDTFGPGEYEKDSSVDQGARHRRYGASKYDGRKKEAAGDAAKLDKKPGGHTGAGSRGTKRHQISRAADYGDPGSKLTHVNQSAIKHAAMHESLEDSTTYKLAEIMGTSNNGGGGAQPFSAQIPDIEQN